MSITDELREWMRARGMMAKETFDQLTAIADRIDAAHRAALEKLAAQLDESEDGWVRLPVGADGLALLLGDSVESDHYESGVVTGIQYGLAANGQTRMMVAVRPHHWDTATWHDPKSYYHHRALTVEDVLRQFSDRVCNSGHQWGLDAADTIAEFATKLRLAGDE